MINNRARWYEVSSYEKGKAKSILNSILKCTHKWYSEFNTENMDTDPNNNCDCFNSI